MADNPAPTDQTDQTPPTDNQPAAAPSVPQGYSYSGAIAAAQQALANQPRQTINPRQNQQGTFRFPGQADFSELYPNQGQQPPPPGFDNVQTDLTQLPNYDKLSAAERFVMSTLPGWAGELKDQYAKWDAGWGGVPGKVLTPVGSIWEAGKNFLGYLGTTGVGKAGANLLGALDVGAETVERGTGFAAQWIGSWQSPEMGADFQNNIKAAWYAGTLAADAADVPSIFDPVSSVMHVPQTLGGLNVLVKTRQRIAELVSQGVDYHQATITARDEWYSSLGALALRAQLHDVGFHLLADPVNIILPLLKPVERLQMLRTTITGLEATTAGLDEMRKVEVAARAAGDIEKADQLAAKIEAAARTRLSWGEQVVTKILGAGDIEAGKTNVIKLTGGDLGFKPESLPGLKGIQAGKWNPFALTPEARVMEFNTILQDHVTSYVVAANTLPDGTKDVEGIVRAITRARDGAFDPQMGNMILTLEGRSVRATLSGFAAEAEDMLKGWKDSEFERKLLDQMARSLGTSPYDVIKRLDNGEGAALLHTFTQKLGQDAEGGANVARLLGNANLTDLTPDVLDRIHGVLGDKAFVGYTDELFVAELSNRLADHAAQQAIIQFGAKEQGMIRKLAEMTKQAESLAFLRLNPGYPIRNFVNNEITMIARGAFGDMSTKAIDEFWKTLGFEPARLSEALTIEQRTVEEALAAGVKLTPAQEALGKVSLALRETAAGNKGWIDKATDAIRNLGNKIPDKLNASNYARTIERMASRRAFTIGYQRAFPQFYKAAVGGLLDMAPEMGDVLGRDLPATINRAVWGATKESDLDALKVVDNLKMNLRSVMDRTEARTGIKLDSVLSTEFQQSIETRVVDAMKSGKESDLSAVFRSIEQEAQRHIESVVDESLAAMRDEAAAKVQAEGPAAYAKLWADGRDEWWGAQERHAMDMAQVGDYIRGRPPEEAHALWAKLDQENSSYYARQWNRLEARMQGFMDGAAKAGLTGQETVMSDFRRMRGEWEGFFANRTKLQTTFFDEVRNGKPVTKTWDAIATELDGRYKTLIDAETRYQRKIDTSVARMLPPDQQVQFLAWRNKINDFRAADAQNVVAFRKRISQIPPAFRNEAYQAHWADRVKAWKQIQFEESAGKAAMAGNPQAKLWLAPAVEQTKLDLSTVDQLMERKIADPVNALTPEEQAVLDQTWAKYATPDEMKQLNTIQQAANQDVTHPPMVPTAEGQQMIDEQQVAGEVASQGQFFEGQNLDFGHVRTVEATDTGPGKRYQSFDFMSDSNGIHGRSPNRWSFDPGTGTVETPRIWHDENQTAWNAKAPDIKGAQLYSGNTLLKGKERTVFKADKIRLADGTLWTKAPASDIPGWVDAFAETAGYDLGSGVTWPQIEHDLANYLRGTTTDTVFNDLRTAANEAKTKLNAAMAARDSFSAQSLPAAEKQILEMKVRKAEKVSKQAEAALRTSQTERALAPSRAIPMEVDQAAIENNQAQRAFEKSIVERDIWERLQNQGVQQDRAAAQLAQTGPAATATGGPTPGGVGSKFVPPAGTGAGNQIPLTDNPLVGTPIGQGMGAEAAGQPVTRGTVTGPAATGGVPTPGQVSSKGFQQGQIYTITEDNYHLSAGTRLRYDGESKSGLHTFTPVDAAGNPIPKFKNAAGDAIDKMSIQNPPLDRFKPEVGATPPTGVPVSAGAQAPYAGPERRVSAGPLPEGLAADRRAANVQNDQAMADIQKLTAEYQATLGEGGAAAAPVGNPAAAGGPAPTTRTHIPDLNALVPQELYLGTGLDQLWFTRGQQTIRDLEQSALETMREKPLAFKDIPPEAQQAVSAFIEKARGDLADARYGAIRMGEFTRDSALLNYSRRFNYNNWLGTIVPYEFWTTQSAVKWAMHSLDRPAMLSGYLRMRKFLDTAYRPESGFPSRLQGKLRIHLPFMPDWMGKDTFVDPVAIALPFGSWAQPFQQYASQQTADIGAAERTLQSLANDGKISAADMQDALASHSGPTWDRAIALSQQDDTQGRQNAGDFAAMLLPPHLPLLYAWDAAMHGGNLAQSASDRGPVLPITRTIGGVLATLGANPAGPLNPEAALRKALGLHPFGKWDDYYAERELTNMLALGEMSVAEARQAMLTHQGPAWEKAVQRSYVENAGGNLITAAAAVAAIPSDAYPPGEEYLRKLKPAYQAAWDAYDKGDKKALDNFIKEHPGYEERLALFKKPEDRLRQFTQDAFWNQWNGLPTLTRNQLKDQMGADFNKMVGPTSDEIKGFRQNVPVDTLALWLKLMGGNPVGSLTPAAGTTAPSVDLAPPEIAQRAQVFYNMRNQQFPDWKKAQDEYYALPEGQKINLGPRDSALAGQYLNERNAKFGADITAKLAQYDAFGGKSAERTAFAKANGIFDYFDWRDQFKAAHPGLSNAIGFGDTVKQSTTTPQAEYLKSHPVLAAYWDWRRQFLTRNGDLLPYLTDTQKNAAAKNPIVPSSNFQMSPDEWRQALGWSLYNLVLDAAHGDPMPAAVQTQLQRKASALGYPGNLETLIHDAAGVGQ